MAAPASEDRWRWRWRWDGQEPRVGEEDEAVPGCHSETDTDEYYNRHSPSENDDEAVSGRKGATSVVAIPANNVGDASTSCVARGWGGTGKRGRSGSGTGKRGMSSSAEPDLAAAAPKPVLQPVPLAFVPPASSLPSSSVAVASAARATNLSGESSSAQSSVHDDAMEIAAVALAGGGIPRAEAAVHHQPVAPPRPAAGRQNPDGYTCPKCGKWFATHQGLGGHIVGHKHRERELLMPAVPGRGDDAKREQRVHVCGDCGAEFAMGVQLGGHKRKHWAGAPIVPKKKLRAVVQPLLPPPAGPARAADLILPLALPVKADKARPPAAEPAAETNPQPATTRSPVTGRLRLFGVDIVVPAQIGADATQAQQGSPASATKSTGFPPAGSMQ